MGLAPSEEDEDQVDRDQVDRAVSLQVPDSDSFIHSTAKKKGKVTRKSSARKRQKLYKVRDYTPVHSCTWPSYLPGLLSLRLVGATGARNFLRSLFSQLTLSMTRTLIVCWVDRSSVMKTA